MQSPSSTVPKKYCQPDPVIPKNIPKRLIILDDQRPAFKKMLAVGRACFDTQRGSFPIAIRTNTLMTGPSGSGKTALARAVAEALEAAFLPISVAEWVLLGCSQRGAIHTWPMIFDFLLRNRHAKGLVIYLDEIDKLSGIGSWDSWVRQECFKLLDLQIPVGITNAEDEQPSELLMRSAGEVLANKTYILGGGAFQGIWESRSKPSPGFVDQVIRYEEPNLTDLTATIPRELANRFRGDLIVLPELTESDYRRMIQVIGESIPSYLRKTFYEMGERRLPKALQCKQGCRYIEETLLDTLLAEREAMRTNSTPTISLPSQIQVISEEPK